jgi:hypothetical protein
MRINIILAILAVALAVPCWITIDRESIEDFVDQNAVPLLFPGFSSDLVSVVEIRRRLSEDIIKAQNLPPERQFEAIVFQRTGNGWVLLNNVEFGGLAMDPAAIDRDVLDHIASLRLDKGTLVPEENVDDVFRTEQQLTEETGFVIRCLRGPTGPELAKLVLGKSTKRGGEGQEDVEGYYVCRPDRPRDVIVYEPKSGMWNLSLRPTDWADKRIHEFLLSEVESFYFSNALGSAGFRKKKGSAAHWIPIADQCKQGDKSLDLKSLGKVIQEGEGSVSELVSRFTVVRAEEFERQKVTTDDIGNEVEVRATLKDGTEFVLRVGREIPGKNGSAAVSSNHQFKFSIVSFHVDPFRRQDPKDLFRPK